MLKVCSMLRLFARATLVATTLCGLAARAQSDDAKQADPNIVLERVPPKSPDEALAMLPRKKDPALDTTQLAAWTTVSRVLLNLDETITRE